MLKKNIEKKIDTVLFIFLLVTYPLFSFFYHYLIGNNCSLVSWGFGISSYSCSGYYLLLYNIGYLLYILFLLLASLPLLRSFLRWKKILRTFRRIYIWVIFLLILIALIKWLNIQKKDAKNESTSFIKTNSISHTLPIMV